MVQRYFATTPSAGANLYLTFPPQPAGSPTILGPSNLAQLGIKPGTVVTGNLNTRWLFALAGAAAIAPGAAINIDPVAFTVGGAGGIAGTSLVTVAASSNGTGLWAEISGAVLNLTPAGLDVLQREGESDEAFKERVAKAKEAATAAAATTATPSPGAAPPVHPAAPVPPHPAAAPTRPATPPRGSAA